MDYRLEDDGDTIERRWGKAVTAVFQNYEPFWIEHVVPITWRVVDRRCLYVRAGAPKALRKLATYSYGIFLHLAACHEQLEIATKDGNEANAQLFARMGIYVFYGRLYSAGELVPKFLEAGKEVVDKYHGTHLRTVEKRLGTHSTGDLYDRYEVVFKALTKDYRNPQVHDWGFPAIGRLVPKREHLDNWADKDLGELDRLLSEDGAEERIAKEFTDAPAQANDDLPFAEAVINDIWKVVEVELASIGDTARYREDQARGLDRDSPRRAAELVSSETSAASGSIILRKK